MALDEVSAPDVGTDQVGPSFPNSSIPISYLGGILLELTGSGSIGGDSPFLTIPALQARSSGILYAREVLALSPQFGYVPLINTFYTSHHVTSWSIAEIVWNAIQASRSYTSTDPTWSFQTGGSPPAQPPPPNPPTQPPPPNPPTQPQPPAQPPGQPPPSQPPAGGGGGATMPCQPQNDPDQDEMGRLQDCIAANLGTIAQLIDQLIQQGYAPVSGGSGGLDQECCQELVQAINAGLTAVATAITGSTTSAGAPPAPPDLTDVVAAIVQIATALQGYPAVWQAIATALSANLSSIAAAIAGIPATDLSGVVAQLKALFGTIDVPLPVYQALADQGFITAADLQLVGAGEFGAGVMTLFRKMAWNGYVWFASLIGIVWTGSSWKVLPLGETVAHDIAGVLSTALATGADPIYPLVKGLVDAVVAQLTPASPPPLGSPGIDPDAVLAKTLVPAFIVNSVMLVADYLGWEISEQLREYVDLTTAFVGLEEVREFKIGALMREGIVKTAHMQAARLYRQYLPSTGELADWQARGLAPQNAAAFLMGFNGVSDDLQPTVFAAAYSGMQPRQLIRLIETGLFSTSDIQDELTFRGMRPASQARMLLAAPYLATQPQRAQFLSALENAYVSGLLEDTDYTARVDSAWSSSDRDSLSLNTVKLKLQTVEAKALEAEYSGQFKAGLIDLPTFTSQLESIGLTTAMVNFVVAKAEAQMSITLQRQMATSERALVRATAAEERKAAMKAYAAGTFGPTAAAAAAPGATAAVIAGAAASAVALGAALLATGLTPTQVAAWTSLAALQSEGSLRWLYGLQLSPAQASQLRTRLSALTSQRKRQLIDSPTYVAQLKALGLSSEWVNALQASADAMLTPKSSAFAIPVSTS